MVSIVSNTHLWGYIMNYRIDLRAGFVQFVLGADIAGLLCL